MQPIHPLLCALLCNNRRSCERCTITFLSRSPLHPTPHQILTRVPAFLSLSLFAYYFITLACFRYFFPLLLFSLRRQRLCLCAGAVAGGNQGSHERKIAMNDR